MNSYKNIKMNKLIGELYAKLEKKTKFKNALAEKLGLSSGYITNYYFPNGVIPEKNQKAVLDFLKETLENQKQLVKS